MSVGRVARTAAIIFQLCQVLLHGFSNPLVLEISFHFLYSLRDKKERRL